MKVIMDVTFPLCKSLFQERTQLIFLLGTHQAAVQVPFSGLSPSFLLFLMVYKAFEGNKYTGRKRTLKARCYRRKGKEK